MGSTMVGLEGEVRTSEGCGEVHLLKIGGS
jgi:hypothetical protein